MLHSYIEDMNKNFILAVTLTVISKVLVPDTEILLGVDRACF
jgi:hypothetical protein